MSMEPVESPPDTGPHIGYIGSLTRQVWQWVRQRIYAEVTAAGFTDVKPAHVAVFRNPSPDGQSPHELAGQLNITKQSVNELLGHLEQHGYLIREPDPRDSRRRRIRLTAKGRQLEAIMWAAARRAEENAADLVGKERLAEFRRTLTDLVALLGTSDAAQPARQGEPARSPAGPGLLSPGQRGNMKP